MVQDKKKHPKQYVDGLKGISCMLILLGHFSAIYKMSESAPKLDGIVTYCMTESPISIFFNENYWLYLFFVISGYLLALNWKGSTVKSVLQKIVVRFFRFSIPVLGGGIIIYLIQNTIGFYNAHFSKIGTNSWFSSFYCNPIRLMDVLLEPVHVLLNGYSNTNVPFWVLRDMFLASCIIYFIRALYTHENNKLTLKVFCCTCGCLLLALISKNHVMITCLIGMCGAWLESKSEILLRYPHVEKPIYLLGFCSPFIAYGMNLLFLKPIVFLLMLLSVPHLPMVKKLLSAEVPLFFGKISFGIYTFHFPVICSVGMKTLLYFLGNMNASMALLLSLLIVILCSVLLAFLFHITVERFTVWVCNKIRFRLSSE